MQPRISVGDFLRGRLRKMDGSIVEFGFGL